MVGIENGFDSHQFNHLGSSGGGVLKNNPFGFLNSAASSPSKTGGGGINLSTNEYEHLLDTNLEEEEEVGLNLTQPHKHGQDDHANGRIEGDHTGFRRDLLSHDVNSQGHCNKSGSKEGANGVAAGSDCSSCNSCSTKSRLYLKGEKTELTMGEKEKLLECIKVHEVIFNPEHPSRSVRDLVTSAWEDVAEKTGFPVELCKEAWRKIKLAYQNSQRHARSKVNADGSIRKPYYLHKQMTFYEPHLRARDVMNQLVKVDQQAAQERNQKNHQSPGSTPSASVSPQPQPLNLQSQTSLSSPDSVLSQRSNDGCESPLALDARVSATTSEVNYSPNNTSMSSSSPFLSGAISASESAFITSLVMKSMPPVVTSSTISSINDTTFLPSPPQPENRLLKRKLEPDLFVSQQPSLTVSKQPNLVSQTGHLPFNGHISPPVEKPLLKSSSSSSSLLLPSAPFISPLCSSYAPSSVSGYSSLSPPSKQCPPVNTATPPPLEVDADLQFLLSLHADIKSLNFKQKFGFKRKVYSLMEEILNSSGEN